MEYTPIVIMLLIAVSSPIISVALVWRWLNEHRKEMQSMKEENARISTSQQAQAIVGGAIQQQKKADPFEQLEKPLYAMHQQMEELLMEIRGLRSDIDEFLTAHRKTLKVLMGQDEYDGGDPDQKAEEDEVARLLRRYPQLSRNDALARVREQAQYKVGRG